MLNTVIKDPAFGVEDTAEDSVNEIQVKTSTEESAEKVQVKTSADEATAESRPQAQETPEIQTHNEMESVSSELKEQTPAENSNPTNDASSKSSSETKPVILSEVDKLVSDLKAIYELYKVDPDAAKVEREKLIEKAANLSDQNFALFAKNAKEAVNLDIIPEDMYLSTIDSAMRLRKAIENEYHETSQRNNDNTLPYNQNPSASQALGAAGMALGSGVAGLFNGVRKGFDKVKGSDKVELSGLDYEDESLDEPEIERGAIEYEDESLDEPEIERGAIESAIYKSGEAVMVVTADMKLMRAGNAVERTRKDANKQMERLNQHLSNNNLSLSDLEGDAIKATIDKLDVVEGTKVYNAYCDASAAMAKFMKSCVKSEAVANKILNNPKTPEPLTKLCKESVSKTLEAASGIKEKYSDMPMNRINEELNYSFRSDLYGAMKALKIGRLENGEFDLSGVTGEKMKKCVNALGSFKDSVVKFVLGPENAPDKNEEVDVSAEKAAWGTAFKEKWEITKKKSNELKSNLASSVGGYSNAVKDQAAIASSYIKDGKDRALELYDDFKEAASEKLTSAKESLGKMLDGLIGKLKGLLEKLLGKSNKNEQTTEFNANNAQAPIR